MVSSFALLTHLRNSGNGVQVKEIKFESKSRGTLTATVETIENEECVTLNFPANYTEPVGSYDKEDIRDTFLGPKFTPDDVMDVRFSALEKLVPIRLVKNNGEDPESRTMQVQPDFERVLRANFNNSDLIGAIVTIQGDGNWKWGWAGFLLKILCTS